MFVLCFQPATLLKMKLWHKSFLVNFGNFFSLFIYQKQDSSRFGHRYFLASFAKSFKNIQNICGHLRVAVSNNMFIARFYLQDLLFIKMKVKEYQRQLLLENVVYLLNIFDIFLFFTTILTCFDTNLRFFLKNVDF